MRAPAGREFGSGCARRRDELGCLTNRAGGPLDHTRALHQQHHHHHHNCHIGRGQSDCHMDSSWSQFKIVLQSEKSLWFASTGASLLIGTKRTWFWQDGHLLVGFPLPLSGLVGRLVGGPHFARATFAINRVVRFPVNQSSHKYPTEAKTAKVRHAADDYISHAWPHLLVA